MKRNAKNTFVGLLVILAIFILYFVIKLTSYSPHCDGLDVSHHNKDITTSERIQFLYAKATEGSNHVDDKFEYFRNYAKQNNLKFGAYHFMSSKSSPEDQFDNFKLIVGKDIDLIPVLDVEDYLGKRTLSIAQIRNFVKTWNSLCEEYYGKRPIIYCNELYRLYLLGIGNDFWIDNKVTCPIWPCVIHQYTNNDNTLDYNSLCVPINDIML